jgi:hypothetical protein
MNLTATDAAWRINLLINGLRVRLKHPKVEPAGAHA